MDDVVFSPSAEEIHRERRASILIMILLPLPCLTASILLARSGTQTAAWVYLALSLALELLVAVDRVLLLRGLEGLVLALGPQGVQLRWGGEERSFDREKIMSIRMERGALTGKARGLLIRSESGAFQLPWFSAANGFIDALRRSGRETSEARRIPLTAILAGATTLAAGLAYWLFNVPGIWLWPWVAFSFAGLFVAYPFHPFLGPRFLIWDRFLFAALSLCGLLLALFAAGVTIEAGDWTLLSVPRDPGPKRSRAILQLGRSDGEQSLPRLLALLRSGTFNDRRDVALALRYRPSPDVVEALRLASFDREPAVRRAAVNSLGFMGGPKAFRTLVSVLESDRDLAVAREANMALEQLTGISFRTGFGSGMAREEDRRLALAFWRAVLRG